MEVVWLIHPIDIKMTIQALNCSSHQELCELLDTIYYGVANDLKAHLQGLAKPAVKFVPFIKRVRTFNPDTREIDGYEENGLCREKDILIAVGIRMKTTIIHEFTHWLRPDLKEGEARKATEELIRLWKLRIGDGNA